MPKHNARCHRGSQNECQERQIKNPLHNQMADDIENSFMEDVMLAWVMYNFVGAKTGRCRYQNLPGLRQLQVEDTIKTQ